ncbi:hypothetical protein ACFLUT_04335 [Chloroflexota bacterium]
MKVVQRGTMKALPGKTAELTALNSKWMAAVYRHGSPKAVRGYQPLFGGQDYMHTTIFEVEWDSVAEMEQAFEKMMADPEMQAMMPKYDELTEFHSVEIFVPVPMS